MPPEYYELWPRYHWPPPPPPEPEYGAYVALLLVGLLVAPLIRWIALQHEPARHDTRARQLAAVLAGPLAAAIGWLVAIERHIAPSQGIVALYMLVGALFGWGLIEAVMHQLGRRAGLRRAARNQPRYRRKKGPTK